MKPAAAEISNMTYVGYHDLGGRPAIKFGMQVVDDRWYLYMGHLWHNGWSILDVTDPSAPELVNFIEGPPNTWTLQVQVAGGKMITGLERPAGGWGHDDESAASEEGFLIWDVETDPVHPKLLGQFRTGGGGTHRNFYGGGDYVYATAADPEYPAFSYVLKIVDIKDPANPVEVCTFPWPTQNKLPAGERQDANAIHSLSDVEFFLHGPAWVVGDRAYASYGQAGAAILDVSDVREPKVVSNIGFGDLGSDLGCHSAVPFLDRDLMVVNSEAIADDCNEPINYVAVVDIADETKPRAVSLFPLPRPGADTPYRDYYEKGGRFGPHNQHHHQGNPALARLHNHVPLAYFNAGLRLFSIENPRQPEEVAYFVPEDPKTRIGAKPEGKLVTQIEDVVVDARGYMYCSDKNQGLFILKYDGELT